MHAEKVFTDGLPRSFGEGTYVRLTGMLKAASKESSNGSSFMLAFSVKPITSYNEISLHALEVMRAHLKLKQTRSAKENAISGTASYDHVTLSSLLLSSFLLFHDIFAFDILYLQCFTFLIPFEFTYKLLCSHLYGGVGQQLSSGNDSSRGISALQNQILSLLRELPQGDQNGLSLIEMRNSIGRSTVTDAQIRQVFVGFDCKRILGTTGSKLYKVHCAQLHLLSVL